MLALLAAVPILLTIVLTVVFNMSAKKVLPIAWAVIVVIGYFAWEMFWISPRILWRVSSALLIRSSSSSARSC